MWHQDSSQKSQKQTTERPEQNSVSARLNFREGWDFQEKWQKGSRDMSASPRSCGWLVFGRPAAGSVSSQLLRKARRALTQRGNLVACVSTEQG